MARHAGLMAASPGAQRAPPPLEAGQEGCTPASGTMFVEFGVGAAGGAEKQSLGSVKAPLPRAPGGSHLWFKADAEFPESRDSGRQMEIDAIFFFACVFPSV